MIIDFFEPRVPSRRAWTAVLAIAASAAVLFAAAQVITVRQRVLQERAGSAPIVRAVMPSAPRLPPPYSVDARLAVDRAMLPEAAALAELEAVAVLGIQLTSMDVDMTSHSVVIELNAASDSALADYLDQLNAGFATPNWHIQRVATSAGEDLFTTGRARQVVTLTRAF